MSKKRDVDVAGRCPQCGREVAVYAMGKTLRVRAHSRSQNLGTGWRTVPCPVTGMDGADALARVTEQHDSAVLYADKNVLAKEAALADAQNGAATARAQRDAHAAQVAALKARVAGKGGAL